MSSKILQLPTSTHHTKKWNTETPHNYSVPLCQVNGQRTTRLDKEFSKTPGFKKRRLRQSKSIVLPVKQIRTAGGINLEKERLLLLRRLERQFQNGGSDAKYRIKSWQWYRGRSLWSGVAGHYRIYFCYSIFQFSRKIRLLLSNPRRCVLLSGRCQTCLPAVELQSNDRKILALLSSAEGYPQTLQAKCYLLSANGHSAQNSWKQLLSCFL